MEAKSLFMTAIMSHAVSCFSIRAIVFGIVAKAGMSGHTAS